MKYLKWIVVILGVSLVGGLVYAGNYFYDYAVIPSEKDFLSPDTDTITEETQKIETWYTDETNRSRWNLQSEDGLNLSAIFLPADQQEGKTALLAHGYMDTAESMAEYAKMYHDMGYNVLVPDARGHGKSEGDYIGFGWHERKDYLQWIDQVLQNQGKDETITLYGLSMGAATVMMVSGEQLPANVVSIVEDCGYASVKEELTYQLKDLFDLPAFPMIPITSLVTKVRAGYFFGEADATQQLAKNELPIFFIHGKEDKFVPFSMLDEVYQATDAPKEKWAVPHATHADSYNQDPELYREKIKAFLKKYAR
ncbi:alpha/beta hydrolase [Tetragenococcus koreensis]|uniref:Alpha/beta hydrolase n=1 Tax=Tetragenococcus koreensis TaxID=290335 RepID=A0AAN4RIP2_9ENTE|nr:alpha/beta hydrolase [Tetragenococcus koreensis]AYW44966.1 alpha/beta hydrolase [Tetragenococcus koreensis]MCF1585507.1 alpha/beta hydrolase [Tetragenococcus koreensis]MCF1615064.1 alpha/beta hydrolase [Tetragenococcus koreensis]MCF1619213.1 alpha/beta hydrolase [Tetragenococcus koreensis]MCF1624881.1 alpha/beta hydrolase [Tetragenococcus koreensis]